MKTFRQYLIEKAADAAVFIELLKADRFGTVPEVFEYLNSKDKRIERIGKGLFSVVYSKGTNPDYVLKVSKSGDHGKSDAWVDFAKIAMRESGSLWPKILYGGTLGDGGIIAIVEALIIDPDRLDLMFNEKFGMPFEDVSDDLVYDIIDDDPRSDLVVGAAELCRCSVDELIRYVRVAHELGIWDLHSENAGFRRNGEIVFFDPVS